MAKRIILYTGKGGVGKTTVAAATAIEASRRGHRTLVISSDPAHSLADALDRPLGPEPEQVADRLFAQEIDMYYSMRKYWSNIRNLLRIVFKWQGMDAIAAEELAALPGMEEASALLWLDLHATSDEFDLVVVDSAPTGETLTFLTLPQVTDWWITKAFPFQRQALKTVGFAVRKTTGVPLDRGYEELSTMFGKLTAVQKTLADPAISSIRLVANPERMVIREARRAYTYLQLYGYGVDAIVVNRVLPADSSGPEWTGYLEAQKNHLEEIETSFSPLPIFHIPHQRHEVFGLAQLQQIGRTLFAEADPASVFNTEPTYCIDQEGERYRVRLRLPFLDRATASARQFGDELVVQVANQRRHLALPKFLGYYRLAETTVGNGWLTIYFEAPDGT